MHDTLSSVCRYVSPRQIYVFFLTPSIYLYFLPCACACAWCVVFVCVSVKDTLSSVFRLDICQRRSVGEEFILLALSSVGEHSLRVVRGNLQQLFNRALS